MAWWLWVLMGFVLMALELFTPGGFYILFFGAGAVVVGVLVGTEVVTADWMQWLLFSVVSVVAVLVLRPLLVARTQAPVPAVPVDTLVGEAATTLEALAPGAVGRAELRGSTWTARNDDARDLAAGQRCRVTRVDGLVISIRAE